MSADNGIYILKTPVLGGFEWRVEHLQAVDNYSWDDEKNEHTINSHIQIKNAREMWKDSPVFFTEKEAEAYAFNMLDIYQDEGGYVEYGIQRVNIFEEF